MSKDRREDLLAHWRWRFGERLWPVLRLRWRAGVCRLPGILIRSPLRGPAGVTLRVSHNFPKGRDRAEEPRCNAPVHGAAGRAGIAFHKSSWGGMNGLV